MILTGLQHLITTNAGFTALAGTRMFPVTLPEALDFTSLSAMTYQIVGGTSSPTFNTSGMQKLRIQFDCYGLNYMKANLLREALRLLLNGYRGVLNDGTYLQNAELIQSIDFFESEARQFRCVSEFYLWFCFD